MAEGDQISPERFAWAAKKLDWGDTDLIEQLKGGLESRANTALETVLAFHHKGLQRGYKEAKPLIERDIQKGWASKPYALLPFVPCRLAPNLNQEFECVTRM